VEQRGIAAIDPLNRNVSSPTERLHRYEKITPLTPPTPSPRTRSGVHSAARGWLEALSSPRGPVDPGTSPGWRGICGACPASRGVR